MFRAIHRNGAFEATDRERPTLNPVTQDKLQQLGDLELAILICLIAQEHCMFSTEHALNLNLQDELRLVCEATFGLQPVVVSCSAHMTVDEFSEAVLVDSREDEAVTEHRHDALSRPVMSISFGPTRGRSSSPTQFGSNTLDDRRIADVIIATNMDTAPDSVQTQALELMRTRRIFTRTAMHTASKDFMILAVMSKPGARLSLHLNDLFCMSHYHAEDDGLPYSSGDLAKNAVPNFTVDEIRELRTLAEEARLTPEIAAYLHHIVVFMRSNRYIGGGVTATATRQLRAISKTLAPLHGLTFVPPSLVALAVRKIYPHRLILATAETEKSLQWGSDSEAVRQLLLGFTIEDAIEDVLLSVEAPL